MSTIKRRTRAWCFCVTTFILGGMCIGQPVMGSDGDEPVNGDFQTTGTIVLKQLLRSGDFLLLQDITPLQVVGGHVAMKVPCDSDGETLLQVLAGSASESGSALVPLELEFIEDISNPGRDCVYHADLDVEHIKEDILSATGQDVNITDIALANAGNRPVSFGLDNSNSVTVNLLTSPGDGGHGDE